MWIYLRSYPTKCILPPRVKWAFVLQMSVAKAFTQTERQVKLLSLCDGQHNADAVERAQVASNPNFSFKTLLDVFLIMCDLIRVACNYYVIYKTLHNSLNRDLSSATVLWVFTRWGSIMPRVIVCVWHCSAFTILKLFASFPRSIISIQNFPPTLCLHTDTPEPTGQHQECVYNRFRLMETRKERERARIGLKKSNHSITGRFVWHYLWIWLSERILRD